MKPSILVLYYTQSGQLKEILDNLTHPIQKEADTTFAALSTQHPYTLPWKVYDFFNAMPETVKRIPVPMQPLPEAVFQKHYDLVILGYQPWFLNPSLPVTSFMKSDEAKRLLQGKPVLTVIGSRNMWLHAQEKIKEDLMVAGATLVGNIALTDSNPNIISTLTIIRWAFKGQKEPSRFLPAAGVQDKDIRETSRFGQPVLAHLKANTLGQLQETLLHLGAVQLKPGLVLLERRGIGNFRKWADYIRAKGDPENPARTGRVNLFKRLLIVAIFILSPITSLTAFFQLQLNKKKLQEDVAYFRQTRYKKGRI